MIIFIACVVLTACIAGASFIAGRLSERWDRHE